MVDSMVRAMTWNIWWRFGPRWQDRQPGIRATLERFRPDIVALQEAWAGEGTTQAHVLADALQMHAVFASPSYPPAPRIPEWPTGTESILGSLC
jgi:endonuclease/exonuclease/phosphatase family metal-dependent hydrolase